MQALPNDLPVRSAPSLLRLVGSIEFDSLRIACLCGGESLGMTSLPHPHRFRICLKLLHNFRDSSKTLHCLRSVALHLPVKEGIFHLGGGGSKLIGTERKGTVRLLMRGGMGDYRSRIHVNLCQLDFCSCRCSERSGARLWGRIDLRTLLGCLRSGSRLLGWLPTCH